VILKWILYLKRVTNYFFIAKLTFKNIILGLIHGKNALKTWLENIFLIQVKSWLDLDFDLHSGSKSIRIKKIENDWLLFEVFLLLEIKEFLKFENLKLFIEIN
jgi:hypothetical protein